ncbi:MAG: 2-dehydro-3-deoxy-D-gluconate 5-dehydrogenase KduD [Deltaproteobacteria bacterium]|nr:2-dehydro-3-deoxy-D-gluconate 5-dehydrogenase KduD [Deltaproteobacteria bacterium]MBW1920902.1 2-dehydro-3-deoxy-D-gluconate 5-dehydrogenase KduD [Deltaproteobacteria bacterium]MBW1931487.1 2-dehydro-3-deoxy-D-gluconate 5-dehydrogenase KduD [Deltaproteobacteria bacterium]MBW1976719.1 2-dehydro-3-deoxy-D-gluconate 5-dehydrogenase KduD [Deltaproteobacteria bacterium]MBW2044826.1 2-dehydro-3-deoxy-D-gluconate 5-dehydrogenase KduD [Deltaproteobacteria bacterium]
MLDKFHLKGRIAVVTGGTKGIGKAIAVALAEAGADIVAVSRTPNDNLEKNVLALGRRYMHYRADLTNRDQARGVIPSVLEKMRAIDILVNNAGIIRRSPAAEHSEVDWDTTLEIDLSSTFILSQAAGRIMLKKGRGKIINIASVLSFQGGINVAAYASAKHGVVGLTKALANEWASKGINVNALAPSFFTTELTEALRKDPVRMKAITDRTPAGRWGEPEDIAGAAVFLASSASDYVHGVVLPVDGGWLAW